MEGGGIFNEFSHPLVLRGEFIGNEAWSAGGAIANVASSPTVLASRFTGEPGTLDYLLVDCTEPFEDISGSGIVAPTASGSDDGGDVVSLGFTFKFFDVEHTEIGISSNGYLTFGSDLSDYTNDTIPDIEAPNDLIAPFWDDWYPAMNGIVEPLASICFWTSGSFATARNIPT